MSILNSTIELATSGNGDMCDLTAKLKQFIAKEGLIEGALTCFVIGSTACLTTIEFEPGLKADLPAILDELIPASRDWRHHRTWGDYNGGAHLKASLIGPDITIPVIDGQMTLGTWQQVILVDFDDHSRHRQIICQFQGETS